MKFLVDSWDPAYGVSDRQNGEGSTDRQVDVSVERHANDWQPLSPRGVAPHEVVSFVDGVRRIDARIWVDDTAGELPGVCASVAAGVVRCTPAEAVVSSTMVRRGLYSSSDQASSLNFVTTSGTVVHYELRKVELSENAANVDDDIYLSVHNHMAEVEHAVSLDELSAGSVLVVFDGPLGRRNHPGAVGYIKTQHVHYLDESLRPVIAQLEPGQRTPIFAITGPAVTYSWYSRLPGPLGHGLSGVVRVEIPDLGTVTDLIKRADQVTVTLGRYASAAHKDSRAPQNLYPIAGLERRLRHQLGDVHLLERALRTYAAQNR